MKIKKNFILKILIFSLLLISINSFYVKDVLGVATSIESITCQEKVEDNSTICQLLVKLSYPVPFEVRRIYLDRLVLSLYPAKWVKKEKTLEISCPAIRKVKIEKIGTENIDLHIFLAHSTSKFSYNTQTEPAMIVIEVEDSEIKQKTLEKKEEMKETEKRVEEKKEPEKKFEEKKPEEPVDSKDVEEEPISKKEESAPKPSPSYDSSKDVIKEEISEPLLESIKDFQPSQVPENDEEAARILIKSAQDALSEKQEEVARKYFNRIINDYPQTEASKDAYISLGDLYFEKLKNQDPKQRGSIDYKQALQYYQQVAKNYSKSSQAPLAWLKIGLLHELMGFYYEAQYALEQVVNKYPDSAYVRESRLRGGEALLQAGSYSDAMVCLKPLLEAQERDQLLIQATYLLGECYYRIQDWGKALEYFKIATSDSKGKELLDSFEFYKYSFMIGMSYYNLDQCQNALEFFNHFLAFESEDADQAEAILRLGQCHKKLGQNKEALDDLARLLKEYPDSKWVLEAKMSMADIKTLEESGVQVPKHDATYKPFLDPSATYEEIAAKATSLKVEVEARRHLGILLLQQNQPLKAIEAFSMNIRLLSKTASSAQDHKYLLEALNLGLQQLNRNDCLQVVELYEKFAPEIKSLANIEYFCNVAYCLIKLGFKENAEKLLTDLQNLTLKPDQKASLDAVRVYLALEYEELQEAENIAQQIPSQIAKNAYFEASRCLAEKYFQYHEYSKALAEYEKIDQAVAPQANSNMTGSDYYQMGQCNLKLEKNEAALESFQKCTNQAASSANSSAFTSKEILCTCRLAGADLLYGLGNYETALQAYLDLKNSCTAGNKGLDENENQGGSTAGNGGSTAGNNRLPWILYQLIECNLQLGLENEAKGYFVQLSEQFPDNFWTEQAGWKIPEQP